LLLNSIKEKAPYDSRCIRRNIEGLCLADKQIFSCLIKGWTASHDMNTHKKNFVPDHTLVDKEIAVNKTYKIPAMVKFTTQWGRGGCLWPFGLLQQNIINE
jgi:hypothetical protein